MSRTEAHADLHSALLSLNERWLEARSIWNDGIAAEFEREFWSEIVQATRSLERSAEMLHEAMEQALRHSEV